MKMFGKLLLITTTVFVFSLTTILPTLAATIKSAESVYISEDQKNLRDLYLFGSSVTLDAPVENDITTAGGSVTLNGDVTGSILALGGDVVIRSHVGNTLRAAGGNVAVSGPIEHDALIAAGNIQLSDTASVSGDLLIAGGQIQINSPVKGNLYINGGGVTLNSTIGGNVSGNMGELTLGSKAVINGNLTYQADEEASISKGAVVRGIHNFTKFAERKDERWGLAKAFTKRSVYKLATDIIISILLLTFLPLFTKNILEKIINSPAASAGTGFLFLSLWPIFSIFLLFLLWVGIASFLFYGLTLLFALFLGKILLGWWLVRWWEQRSKREYVLDWKAAVTGSIAVFLLFLIPIIGWLTAFIIYLAAIGGMVRYLLSLTKKEQVHVPV